MFLLCLFTFQLFDLFEGAFKPIVSSIVHQATKLSLVLETDSKVFKPVVSSIVHQATKLSLVLEIDSKVLV